MKALISAFLTFSPGWSAKLVNDSLKCFYAIPQKITKFGLYVETMDELDDKNILLVIRSISDHFANIDTLDLIVGDCMVHRVRPFVTPAASIDDLVQKNPKALASALSCFTELRELDVRFWEQPSKDKQLAYFFQYHKLKLCEAWSGRCPSLAYILLPDYDGRSKDLGWRHRQLFQSSIT